MRVSADSWFGAMSHRNKVEAVSSFHSTLHSSDASTMSQLLLDKQPSVCESEQKLSIP